MAKKKDGKNSKSKAFAGFKRDKKTLKGPFTRVSEQNPGVMQKSTWHDVQLPEFLWVSLVLSAFEEEDALAILRSIAASWPDGKGFKQSGYGGTAGSFTSIAALKSPARKALLAFIAEAIDDRSILAPLCNLEGLPALNDWKEFFLEEEDREQWLLIASAIDESMVFQGKNATHICWFSSCVGAVSGQMTVPEGIAVKLDEMRSGYPANAELVGGHFRAEMGSSRLEMKSSWPEEFWAEVYMKLGIVTAPPEHQYLTENDLGAACCITSLLGYLSEHYRRTRQHSDDKVHEMTFGIMLSAINLAYEVIELRTHNRFAGLATLRMLTESAINLAYLATENSPELWLKFRKYGNGQAYLIDTKIDNELACTHCIDPDYIQAFLFEEDKKIFTDIELGDWSGKNLRARAESSNTKDLYDSYYDYTSSMLHGDWLGASTFGMTWDLNPLHRLQRVPRQFPRCLPSVVPDLFIVTNRILDLLDKLYPEFKFRLPKPSPPTWSEDAEDDSE